MALSREEKKTVLQAVELLRQAALASYDDSLADFPVAGDETVYMYGIPRYLLFMRCTGAMVYLMHRVWGFIE